MTTCKRTSHSNCVHPEGCDWCGEPCTGLFCSTYCYEADRDNFTARLDAMFITQDVGICGGCGAYGRPGQPHVRRGEECGVFA